MTLSKKEIAFRVRKTAALATLGAGGYMDVMMYFNLVEEELAAHKENEGDECPLCQLETEMGILKGDYEKLLLLTEVFLDKILAYADHKRGCTWDDRTKGDICTCGFRPLIYELYVARDTYDDMLEK